MFSDQEQPNSSFPITTDLSLRTGSSSNYVPSKLIKRQRSLVENGSTSTTGSGNINIFGNEVKDLSSSSSSSRNYHQFVDGFISSSLMNIGYGGYNNQSAGLFGYDRVNTSSSASDKIRHRMIKNRESAARSRARKQALEAQQQLEKTELKKENDILKRIVRFLIAIVRSKSMKLPTLSRSFSAPF